MSGSFPYDKIDGFDRNESRDEILISINNITNSARHVHWEERDQLRYSSIRHLFDTEHMTGNHS